MRARTRNPRCAVSSHPAQRLAVDDSTGLRNHGVRSGPGLIGLVHSLLGIRRPGGGEGRDRQQPRGRKVAHAAHGAVPSTPLHDFAYHTIAFPVPSAGGDARAMRAHRQAFPTPRGGTGGVPPTPYAGGAPATPEGAGNATRRAALRGPRTSSRAACDAPASRRAALLAGNLARPSYDARIRAREY